MDLEKVLHEEAVKARKHKAVNVNDHGYTVEYLKQHRPHLYYDKDKGKVKTGGGGGDVKSFLKMKREIPVIKGVQVIVK